MPKTFYTPLKINTGGWKSQRFEQFWAITFTFSLSFLLVHDTSLLNLSFLIKNVYNLWVQQQQLRACLSCQCWF